MKIGIIHLSDIHFRKDRFDENLDNEMARGICAAIKTDLMGSTHILLIVSGDIAYSGQKEEYEYAGNWFSELYTLIDDACEATCWILCAPGNHDIDHSENRKIRTILIERIGQDPSICYDNEIIEECVKEQKYFFDFVKRTESEDNLIFDDPLLRIHRIYDETAEIQINILNSAWMSSLDERQGSIVYPVDKFYEQLKGFEGFTITALHHPLSWFQTENSRELRDKISKTSSIVFFGHEHIPDSTQMATSSEDHVRFIDGGVLTFSQTERNNSFNLVLLDTDACKMQENVFIRTDTRYESIKRTDWQDAGRLASAESSRFRLIAPQREQIESMGINILHPRRDQLFLRDLFVYPDLLPINKQMPHSDPNKWERMISSEKLIFDQNSSHVILQGGEKSGKTALLRVLFLDLYKRGKIPLYIVPSNINTKNDDSIRASLERIFRNTYEGEDFVGYEQLDLSDRVILLDDFQFSRKNPNMTKRLLDFIRKFSSKSIVTTEESITTEQLISKEKQSAIPHEYDLYFIQEFGHLKRDELIKRWLLLGRQHEGWSRPSIINEREHARLAINTTIGRNFMPSNPIIILIILQSIETVSPSLIGSTYGHYYHFLITRSLMNGGVKSEDLDAYSNYISELAYWIFANSGNSRKLSEDQYVTWHRQFCTDYGVDWNTTVIKETLERSNILVIESTKFTYFKYQYIFYFFLAKYLSSRLMDSNIRDIVLRMCSHLHVSEYANIILFLIHHSNDQFVLDSTRQAASLLMKQQKLFSFERTKNNILLDTINRLPSSLRVQFIEDRDPEIEQQRILEDKDIAEAREGKIEDNSEDEVEIEKQSMDDLDNLAQADIAEKTVELLGQILKNYYGSLRIDIKVLIGKDMVELALKALHSYFDSLISADLEHIIEELAYIRHEYEEKNVKKSSRKDNVELQHWARDFVFSLCTLVARSIVQKTAEAIGSRQIKQTLTRLISKHDSIGYRMIEIAVLLDSPSEIPREQIESMVRRLNDNPLGFQILRDLVAQRIYRYPMKYQDKQWLASKLNFSMAGQRSVELHKSSRLLPS